MKDVFVGKTIEEAKANAASAFGADISEIKFTVIEEPKKGLFGKLKGEARVEAEYEPSTQALSEEVIEVQKGDILIEEDIIRYEDMYGRV